MFEVNGVYANRKGKYTVLSVSGDKMTVRYEDGSENTLRMGIQFRIWENISSEIEEASLKEASKKGPAQSTQFFIKAISSPTNDMTFPGWQERVVLAHPKEMAKKLRAGDRLIYYAIEAQVFFGVQTITGDSTKADPKKYLYTLAEKKAFFFPTDIDAAISTFEKGIPFDSMELESQPNFKTLTLEPESFLTINEDDFELVAELITELTESEEDDDSGTVEEFVEEEEEIQI